MVPAGSPELVVELKALRKGRGLQTVRLADQVGPALRQLCGVAGNDDSATIRDKVARRLRILADSLPEDLREVVTIALALQPDSQQQFLQERVRQLAERQRRDVRTIRRRMDEGFERLAELAAQSRAESARGSGYGWYVERMEAIVRMDKPAPECFERRRIVADYDGLDQIQAMVTVPRPDRDAGARHGLDVDVYFGATLLGARRHSGMFVFDLGLPKALALGEEHEFGLVLRVPDEQLMRPHYVVVPDRRYDEFELRIRFAPGRAPGLIWRVSDVFHRELDDARPTDDVLVVDGAGELNLAFKNLRPGHAYGAQWLPA
jgi:hypothetical protein